MLLQTRYRLDPWRFEPPVESFAPVRFDLNSARFSLYIDYLPAVEGGRDASLRIRALYLCDDVPAEVTALLANGLNEPIEVLLRGGDGFAAYPTSYREFVLRVHQYMDRTATNLFNVIRWRFGIEGGPLVLSSEWYLMRWHDGPRTGTPLDEHGYLNRQIPAGVLMLQHQPTQRLSLNTEDAAQIERICCAGTLQPLYHDLFREAWQSRADNPRSSLVMAIAAAETALKTTAVDLCGDSGTEWVFEHLPSPPLDRMLRDYVQLLPARQKIGEAVRRPPTRAITLIKEAVELRNKLVHGRGRDIDTGRLTDMLCAVRDVLYLLDYYRGHAWALERCSTVFMQELNKGEK